MESAKLPLSACFIAKNEADRLPAALNAVRGLCDDIVVVVDASTTDSTADVAAAHGARVLTRAWTGFGEQKRFAEENATNNWILSLDADEVLTPELGNEIRALFAAAPKHNFYNIKVVDVYPGHTRPRLFAKPTNVVRLFDRRRGMTSRSATHDRAEVPVGESVGQLDNIVLHYSIRSLDHLRGKYDSYTTLAAETQKKKSRVALAIRLLTELPVTFVQNYFGQRHFTGGITGLQVAGIKAYARWNRIRKMWNVA
ncbi:MAG: glycosyltransferase family 2 protein [Bdellovibrionales bacterium]